MAASKKSQLGRRAAERKLRAGSNSENNFQIGCGPWAAPSRDLEQPIRDWQNISIMATQNDLIDLSGDFEETMYDLLVEELLQASDAHSSLQTGVQNIWMN